jgi:cation:H+ antiporter
MLVPSLLIVAAIALLYFGAEFSLDASEKVGKRLGLSPLVIGMVLIGFGTSLPEFFVGHIAGMRGKPDIAVGTLVGSNIANMFLIIGICGLLSRLDIDGKSLREHLWVHLLLGVVLAFILSGDRINFVTGGALLIVVLVYMFFIYKDMQREYEKSRSQDLVPDREGMGNPAVMMIKMISGFGMLYLGGELLVKGGTDLAKTAGIADYIISAIFIAFGTSFPELVTAVLASFRKKDTDMIIGNIVGSNLFNCAFILGSMGIYDFALSKNFLFEIVALVGGGVFFLGLAYTVKGFARFSGLIFLSSYGVMVAHWLNVI